MNESLKALAEKVMADDAFQAKFAAVKNTTRRMNLRAALCMDLAKTSL